MKIGISIPNNWGVENPADLADLAVLAEELGFASVWTSEHLINTSYVQTRIGSGPYYHPLAPLSFIAARTSRIALATSVVVLPFHHPFELAKYVATLDRFANGRVILGVGVGNVPEEFAAMNIPWEQRGSITDETMAVLKALWSNDSASFAGKHWNFTDIRTWPKPFQRPHVPMWVGGMSKAAMRRTARLGDGWHPTAITVEQFAAARAEIVAMADAEGRDGKALDFCMRVNVALEGETYNEVELRSMVPGDDMPAVAASVREFADAGATHFILALNSSNMPVVQDTVRRIAADVLPEFH